MLVSKPPGGKREKNIDLDEIFGPDSDSAKTEQPSISADSDSTIVLSVSPPPDAGFSPEDISWTAAALSKHFGCPIKLYDREEFLNREREEVSPCPTNAKPADVPPSSASRCPPSCLPFEERST
jgi:hypothetical protein